MNRIILHCDCNSFYASVETVLNPAYKNVPMAVCGSESDRHGIVLAKNELAKKYNIQTAETVYSAKKKCPSLVIAEPHHSEYVKYSKAVNRIYSRYTDMIEPFGIDESWLDVTRSTKLFGGGLEIAEKIRKEVREETGLTVSIGVSFNKIFAKLGSDYKKPDAITLIDEVNFRNIVFPLPVSDLLFVGKKTAKILFSAGIRTIGQLAATNQELLESLLGKMGDVLHKYANGLDNSPVCPSHDDAKSISNGFTFKHDLVRRDEYRTGIDYLCEEIGEKLRQKRLLCGTVAVTIKDENLNVIQRQRPQHPPTDITKEISRTAFNVLSDAWAEGKPIRMITVSATNLERRENASEQISFFDVNTNEKREKSEKRDNAVDKIRQKYGSSSIVNGAIIDSDIGIYDKKQRD